MKHAPVLALVPQLHTLWKTVFGDDDGYIDLFFSSAYQNSRVFLKETEKSVCSALYLLDCSIVLEGEKLDGFYLYAAATAPHMRKKGYMGALIEEAKASLAAEKKAFITLVPATDALYQYYSKFGFVTAMRQFAGSLKGSGTQQPREMTAAQYYAYAANAGLDRFLWTKDNHAYALDCLSYYGMRPYQCADTVFLSDGNEVKEVLSPCAETAVRDLKAALPGGKSLEVHSPLPLPGFAPRRFGMIYAPDNTLLQRLEKNPVYMNLALD